MSEASRRSLKARVLESAALGLGTNVANIAIRMISHIVLAAHLLPSDYALFGLALSLQQGIVLISDIGVQSNIIRSEHSEKQEFINVAWTMQLLQALVICIGMSILALVLWQTLTGTGDPTKSVYYDERLPVIIVVLGFNVLLLAFRSCRRALEVRNVNARIPMLHSFLSALAGAVASITYVIIWGGLWAFVAGVVATAVVDVALSHIAFFDRKLRLSLNREYFLEFFHFGKWVTVSSTLQFLVQRSDRLLASVLMEPAILGLYEVSRTWFELAQNMRNRLYGSVFMPAMSEGMREKKQLRPIYYGLRLGFDALSLAGAVALIFGSHIVFPHIYNADYQGALDFTWMYGLIFLATSYQTINNILVVHGNTKLASGLQFYRALVLVPVLAGIVHFAGAAYLPLSMLVMHMIMLPYTFSLKRRYLEVDLLRDLIPVALMVGLFAFYELIFMPLWT